VTGKTYVGKPGTGKLGGGAAAAVQNTNKISAAGSNDKK
jgi:hypothetical protein